MNTKSRICVISALMLLSSILVAGEGNDREPVSVTVQVTYQLSPADSQLSALEAARTMAKYEAANQAGSFIEGVTSLRNGILSESIREVQASVVQLTQEKTRFSVHPEAKNGELTLSAVAHVNTNVMKSRMEALNENRRLATKIDALSRDNERLRAALNELGKETVKSIGTVSLEHRRLGLESQIRKNRNRLQSAFSGGSLMDRRNDDKFWIDLKNQALKREVIDKLLQVPVTAKIESVSGNQEMTTARVRISSGLAPDGVMTHFLDVFKSPEQLSEMKRRRYFRIEDNVAITPYHLKEAMEESSNFNPHALEQRNFLSGFYVATEVSIGSGKVYLPVLGVNTDNRCRYDVDFRFRKWKKAAEKKYEYSSRKSICLFNDKETQSNLVEIKIANEEARQVTGVEVRRVLVKMPEGKIL